MIVEKVEYISREICHFETQDDIALTNHIEEDHEETLGRADLISISRSSPPWILGIFEIKIKIIK